MRFHQHAIGVVGAQPAAFQHLHSIDRWLPFCRNANEAGANGLAIGKQVAGIGDQTGCDGTHTGDACDLCGGFLWGRLHPHRQVGKMQGFVSMMI